MTMNFNTENAGFRKIMSNGLQYKVPRFQRDYAWKQEQWEDLWEDLEATENETQHYLGYLVFQSNDNKTFSVIDGQQRLTTISLIIISALYRLKKLINDGVDANASEKRLETLRNSFVGFTDPVSLVNKPKLELNRNNDKYFRNYICALERPPMRKISASERLLANAILFFGERLDEKGLGKDGAQIAQFIEDLIDKLLFTTITVGSDLNAYRVFETLNARGVQLSVPDLLKNYLFSLIDNSQEIDDRELERLEEDWEAITNQLGRSDFTRFVQAEWNSRNPLVKRGQLFKRIKSAISSREQAFSYLRKLRESAEVYAALQDANDEFWQRDQYTAAQAPLRALNLFNISQPHAMLLAAYRKFKATHYCKLLEAVETISIRYNVIGSRPTNEQETVYNRTARQIADGTIRNLQATKRSLKKVYPSDEEFTNDFGRKHMRTSQSPKKVRYLLAQLERKINPGAALDDAALTLEHVLPENPEQGWAEYFGVTDIDECIGAIGNMTLMDSQQNASLAREAFGQKIAILRNSALQISKKIAQYDDWNKESVEDRQKWLAKVAVSRWSIQFD